MIDRLRVREVKDHSVSDFHEMETGRSVHIDVKQAAN
jgi:hypothetical protein